MFIKTFLLNFRIAFHFPYRTVARECQDRSSARTTDFTSTRVLFVTSGGEFGESSGASGLGLRMSGGSETSAGRWFTMGSGSGNEAEQSSGFPSLPNISIPGITRQQEPSFADEMSEICPKLTFQQRLTGFCICLGLGYLLSFISTATLSSGQMNSFATIYCLGSFVALAATGFLIGPRSQCRKMFHKKRRISCIIYLSLLILVFVLALAGMPVGLVLLLLILQMMAAIWYTASYIPYGRAMIKSFLCPCLKDLENEGQTG